MIDKLRLIVFGSARCGKTPIVNALSAFEGCRFEDEARLFENLLETDNPLVTLEELCNTEYKDFNVIADRTGCNPNAKYGPLDMYKVGLVNKFIHVSRDPRDTLYDDYRIWRLGNPDALEDRWYDHVKPLRYKKWEDSARFWLGFKEQIPHVHVKFEELSSQLVYIAWHISNFLGLNPFVLCNNLCIAFNREKSKIGIHKAHLVLCDLFPLEVDEKLVLQMGYEI